MNRNDSHQISDWLEILIFISSKMKVDESWEIGIFMLDKGLFVIW